MSEGFVILVNRNDKYLRMLDIVIDSVLSFSDKYVEVFGVNFKYEPKNDRVYGNRVDVGTENYDSICLGKIKAMRNSRFDFGVYIDTDIIITKDAVSLFDIKDKVGSYPLYPVHPQHPENNTSFIALMRQFGVTSPTQPYIHASSCLFNKSCSDFFDGTLGMWSSLLKNGQSSFAGDEGLVNINLWKHKVNDYYLPTYDLSYKYFVDSKYHYQLEGTTYWKYMCHGCKDINLAEKILADLKQKKGTM